MSLMFRTRCLREASWKRTCLCWCWCSCSSIQFMSVRGETPSNSTYRKVMCSKLVTSKHATKIRTKRYRKHTVRELTHDRTTQDTTAIRVQLLMILMWIHHQNVKMMHQLGYQRVSTDLFRPASASVMCRVVKKHLTSNVLHTPGIQHQNSVNLT